MGYVLLFKFFVILFCFHSHNYRIDLYAEFYPNLPLFLYYNFSRFSFQVSGLHLLGLSRMGCEFGGPKCKFRPTKNFTIIFMLLLLSGDVHLNPGPSQCNYCLKSILHRSRALQCRACHCWVHYFCHLDNDNFVSFSYRNNIFYCCHCLQDALPFNSLNDEDFQLEIFNNRVEMEYTKTSFVDIKHGFHNMMDDGIPTFSAPIDTKYMFEDDFNRFSKDFGDSEIFSIIHFNSRSLQNNFFNISEYLNTIDFTFGIIALSETWLQGSLPSLFQLSPYKFIDVHRSGKLGGGVGMYILREIVFKIREEWSNSTELCDTLFIEINNTKQKNIIVGVIYRPPGKSIGLFNDYIEGILEAIMRENKVFYLLGDFNINLLNYDTQSLIGNFYNLMVSYGLQLLINRPTRITITSSTLIDLIFTNVISCKIDAGILLTDITDHFPVFQLSHTSYDKCCATETRLTRSITPGNILNFYSALALVGWDNVLACMDPNEAYKVFLGSFFLLYEKYFPLVRGNAISKRFRKPWMSRYLLRLINRKNKLYIRFLKSSTREDKEKYTKLRNRLSHLLRIAKKSYYSSRIESCKNNSKETWKIIGDILNKRKDTDFPKAFKCSLNSGNSIFTNLEEIAEQFNNIFVNTGSDLAQKIPSTEATFSSFLGSSNSQSLFFVPTTPEEIILIVKSFVTKRSCGYDEISPVVVKEVIELISIPLSHIVNQSLLTGEIPEDLKIAKITPIYKNGHNSFFSNYRPISVLPFFSKVFERVVYKRIQEFLEHCDLLYDNQYGFRKGHSTYMAIAKLTEGIIKEMEDHNITIGIFLDLSKAFDTVDHQILLEKLFFYGIRGVPHKWLSNYLTNRYQHVQFRSTISSNKLINCGVPQGSILGPLLFLIYINDIYRVSDKMSFILFADDTNIFYSTDSLLELSDIVNTELCRLTDWFRANKLSLNVNKSNFMIFKNRQRNIDLSQISILIDNSPISQVSHTKFLGVILDSNLNWNSHLDGVIKKTAINIGVINKLRYTLPEKTLRNLYYTLVYPFLHYCHLNWGVTSKGMLDKLFKLQKRVVRIVKNSGFLDHTDPLFFKMNILKLDDIYKYQLGIFMYREHKGFLPKPFQNIFAPVNKLHGYHTRNAAAVYKKFFRTTQGQKSIFFRGPNLWNELDNHLKDCESETIFRSKFRCQLVKQYNK